jgi:hypothetical protein
MYKRDDGPPPCVECGEPNSISWHGGGGPSVSGFGTVTTANGEMTTGDFNARCRAIEAQNPGQRISVTVPTDSQVDRSIDERRQRVIDSRRARGIDVANASDARVETLTKKKEDIERGRVPTQDVHKDVAAVEQKIARTEQSFKTTA